MIPRDEAKAIKDAPFAKPLDLSRIIVLGDRTTVLWKEWKLCVEPSVRQEKGG